MKIQRIQLCAKTAVGLAALLTCCFCPSGALLVPETDAFHHCTTRRSTNLAGFGTCCFPERHAAQNVRHHASSHLLVLLNMGLYDKPLPPRPPPRKEEPNNNDKDGDSEDENDAVMSSIRLFEFNDKGQEVNDLLPALSRRLDTGIACYFEPQERLVQNLVDKTSCHVDDACWALEACQGDITEAWTRISMARRLAFNNTKRGRSVDPVDEALFDIKMQQQFAQRKQNIIDEEKRRNAQDFWKSAKPKNEQWTPGKSNPRPIDDEPWFTG
jgi:hypothetical protein